MKLVFAVLASLIAAPAVAQVAPLNCDEASTTVDAAECADKNFKRADAELNRVFPRALSSIDKQDHLTPEQRAKWKTVLRETQRTWVKFKQLDCDEAIGFEWYGGTGMGRASLECAREKTEARTRELIERYGVK